MKDAQYYHQVLNHMEDDLQPVFDKRDMYRRLCTNEAISMIGPKRESYIKDVCHLYNAISETAIGDCLYVNVKLNEFHKLTTRILYLHNQSQFVNCNVDSNSSLLFSTQSVVNANYYLSTSEDFLEHKNNSHKTTITTPDDIESTLFGFKLTTKSEFHDILMLHEIFKYLMIKNKFNEVLDDFNGSFVYYYEGLL